MENAKPVRVLHVSLWRVRKQRRQEAKRKDKQMIERLQSYVLQLEYEVKTWQRWYRSWQEGEELEAAIACFAAEEQQNTAAKVAEHQQKVASEEQEHQQRLAPEEQQRMDGKSVEIRDAGGDEVLTTRGIDYSKWDQLSCSSSDKDGDDKFASSLSESDGDGSAAGYDLDNEEETTLKFPECHGQ